VVFIRDSVAQQAALRSGDIDLITAAPLEAFFALSRAPGIRAYSEQVGYHHVINTQANLAPFDNPKVRQAFKLILDRPAVRASVLLSQGDIGNDVPLAPGSFYLPPWRRPPRTCRAPRRC
jgi:peptide/nickel transport system substrate-binding protein